MNKRLILKALIFSWVIFSSASGAAAQDNTIFPEEITHSNIKEDRFFISWITDEDQTGWVNYGRTDSLGNIVYDVRGQDYKGKTHYVEVKNLDYSSAVYYYDIISGGFTDDKDGSHYEIMSGVDVSPGMNIDLIYGQVFLEDETTIAEGAIVYIWLKDNDGIGTNGNSQRCSFLVGDDGYWYYDLKTVRTDSFSNYFEYSLNGGDTIALEVKGPNGELVSLNRDTSEKTSIPNIVFKHNTTPILEWIGEAGYENSGVVPQMGLGLTDFSFKIKYIDLDGDAPAANKLYLDKNGDGDYSDAGEVMEMVSSGSGYSEGVIFYYTTKIPYSVFSQNCSYYFYFSDGKDSAVGNITQAISAETAINKPDISQTLSVSIDKTLWELPQISAGSQYVTDNISKIKVTNSGDGAQTYSLKLAEQGEWFASADKDGVGVNMFVLSGIFTEGSEIDVGSAYFNENGSDDVIPAGIFAKAGDSRFASSQAPQNGALVPAGEDRNLWLEFKAPLKDTKGGEQSIKITVNAEVP